MKKIILLFFPLLFSKFMITAQIKLPKDFRCVLGENYSTESYFTNGSSNFQLHAWGHEGIDGIDVINAIESNWDHLFKFHKTKDGIYWATGKNGNAYFYTLLVDGAIQLTYESKYNNSQFSNLSTWLLQEARNKMSYKGDYYFTDYLGRSCDGVK